MLVLAVGKNPLVQDKQRTQTKPLGLYVSQTLFRVHSVPLLPFNLYEFLIAKPNRTFISPHVLKNSASYDNE